MTQENQAVEEPTIDFAGILRRRWLTIGIGLILGVGPAILYFVIAPRSYSSRLEVLVMQKDPHLPMMAQALAQRPQQEIGDALLATHMEIIRSPVVVGSAVKKHKLDALHSVRIALDPELAALDRHRATVKYIINQLSIERGGEELGYAPLTFVAEFHHASPGDSASVLVAISDAYQDFLADTLQGENSEARDLITEANEKLATDIDVLEEKYREFRKNSSLLSLGPDSLTKTQIRLRHLHAELVRLELRETKLKSRAKLLKDAAKDVEDFSDLERLGLVDVHDVERMSLLVRVERGDANSSETFVAQQPARLSTESAEVGSLLEYNIRLGDEQSRLGANHPKVVELRKGVERIEAFLATRRANTETPAKESKLRSGDLASVYMKILDKEIEDAKNQIESTQSRIHKEEQEAASLVGDELKGKGLLDSLNATKQLRLAVVDRLRQLNLMQNYGGFVTEILRAPAYGELAWPKLPIVLFVGLCLGTLVGGGMALLLDISDRSFRNVADIQSVMGAPMLGAIRSMKFRHRKGASRRVSPEVVVYHHTESAQAEAYRHVRTALMFRPEAKEMRLLQMTSPNPSDGKTLTTANLAVSLAQTGKQVLLVDTDLRKPRLGKLFSVYDDPGLSDVLLNDVDPDDVIQKTDVDNLYIMPSGPRPRNPSELLQTARFFSLLDLLREKFDFVLLDSTALLVVSESISISGKVDGVIVSLRTQNTSRPEAERAVQQLVSVGRSPIGFVVNDIDHLSRTGTEGKNSYEYSYYGERSNTNKYFQPVGESKN